MLGVIQIIWASFDPPPIISIQPSPQAHHLDPFDTFDTFGTSLISVKRGYKNFS